MHIPHPTAPILRALPRVWAGVALLLATAAGAETLAAPSSSSFLSSCAGALDHSSSSIVSHDGRQTWTVKLDGTKCSVDFRMEGKAQFNDDFTDLVSLSSDGSFRLDVTDDGVRRQLEIEPGPTGLVRIWKVNGRGQPYDAAARAWLAMVLVELDRRNAVAVDQRLPHLLRRGGVAAVLDETGHMGEYARSVYYAKLAAATRLSNADIARILEQAASLGTSDYYAAELLKSLGSSTRGDAGARAAMFRLIQAMKEDYYRTEAVRQVVGKGPLGAREMDLLVELLPRVESAYYRTELLKYVLAVGNLNASQWKRLAGLARDIHEDSYTYEFVKALTASGNADPGGARALIDATATIESDYYLSESLAAVLSLTTLTEADLLAIVNTASPTKSEYYRSEMLRRVLAHRAVTDHVRQAAVEASGGMSSYYREEVARATGRR